MEVGNRLGARCFESIGNDKNGMGGEGIAIMIGPAGDDGGAPGAFGLDASLVEFGIDGGKEGWSTDADCPGDC